MKPYISGSEIVEVYNSGLIVFLYDESFRDEINAASPKILEYFDDESHLDPKLAELAEKGILVVFQLPQDDELAVEISLGKALEDAELKNLPFLKPSKTRIRIPTGKLCVEGYDALQVGPEEPEEDGGIATVPPGEYTLTVYRENPYAYDDEDDSEENMRPNCLVILSTADQEQPPKKIPSMLMVPPLDPEDAPFDWKDRI